MNLMFFYDAPAFGLPQPNRGNTSLKLRVRTLAERPIALLAGR
jgi:hypothetical protein